MKKRRWISPKPDEIKAIRKKMNLTQVQFSKQFRTELKTLQEWERGWGRPHGLGALLMLLLADRPRLILALMREIDKV